MSARLGGDEFALTLLEDEPAEVIREVEHIRGRFREETAGATLSLGICDGRTLRRASVQRGCMKQTRTSSSYFMPAVLPLSAGAKPQA